jgi:amino acid permease
LGRKILHKQRNHSAVIHKKANKFVPVLIQDPESTQPFILSYLQLSIRKLLLSFIITCIMFPAMVSYNVAVGDTLTKVLMRLAGVGAESLLSHRETVVAFATVLITTPLCLYRDIAKLAKVSFLSLVFVAFILIAIFIRLGTMHDIM